MSRFCGNQKPRVCDPCARFVWLKIQVALHFLMQHTLTWTAAIIAAPLPALWHAVSDLSAEEAPRDLCSSQSAPSKWHFGRYTGYKVACVCIYICILKKWLTRHKVLSSEMRRKSRLWSSRADPIPDLRQLYLQRVLAGLKQTLMMLRWNYLSYLTLFKVGRVVFFHSIWPLDAYGGLWNHNSVIASLCPRFNFL